MQLMRFCQEAVTPISRSDCLQDSAVQKIAFGDYFRHHGARRSSRRTGPALIHTELERRPDGLLARVLAARFHRRREGRSNIAALDMQSLASHYQDRRDNALCV